MAMLSLLREGIQRSAEREEQTFISGARGGNEHDARLALDSLKALPSALQALCELEWKVETPMLVRTLLPVVTTYLLREDDMVPTSEGNILAGALDDAYLTFSACVVAAQELESDSIQDFSAHRDAVRTLLSQEVVEALDHELSSALNDARIMIEQVHLATGE